MSFSYLYSFTLPTEEDFGTITPIDWDTILYVPSHCAEGIDLLTQEYKDKPRINAFLCALLDSCQPLEDTFWQLLTLRSLGNAAGVNLNTLGRIVGEPRKDRADLVYEVFIRIRAKVNRSHGHIEDFLTIMELAFPAGDFYLWEHPPKSLEVFLDQDIGDILPADFVLYLSLAKDAGARLDFRWTVNPIAETFVFNSSDAGQCIGSTTDPDIGGKMGGVSR